MKKQNSLEWSDWCNHDDWLTHLKQETGGKQNE